MAGWLVARWFFGGEMVGGEIPWWRDDRIPFSYVCFFVICFCSVYVIRLFSRCSRFLDNTLDSIFHYLYHDHCLSRGFKQPFTTLGCYCLVIYG